MHIYISATEEYEVKGEGKKRDLDKILKQYGLEKTIFSRKREE